MRTHRLKTHPEQYHAVRRDRKRFEFRKDDRDYAVTLQFYDPAPGAPKTREEQIFPVGPVPEYHPADPSRSRTFFTASRSVTVFCP